jgi:hypothetical protein
MGMTEPDSRRKRNGIEIGTFFEGGLSPEHSQLGENPSTSFVARRDRQDVMFIHSGT